MRIDLSVVRFGEFVAEFPGVVAVVRPLGLEDAAAWADAFPFATRRDKMNASTVALVRQQLLNLEGVTMRDDATSSVVPFDVQNSRHFRSLPDDLVWSIYIGLKERGEVSPDTEKNCEPPSDSRATADHSDAPSADNVPSAPVTL